MFNFKSKLNGRPKKTLNIRANLDKGISQEYKRKPAQLISVDKIWFTKVNFYRPFHANVANFNDNIKR